MTKLTDEQLDSKDVIDATRTAARLLVRIELRRLLNEVEADLLDQMDKRAASGEPYRLDMASVLAHVQKKVQGIRKGLNA